MKTDTPSLPAAAGSSAGQPVGTAHADSFGSTYDTPGFTGASFSQQVPDLLSELRLNRPGASNWGASNWGAAGTRFPE